MLLKFATKKNANGHRQYLFLDTEKKIYAKAPREMAPKVRELKLFELREIEWDLKEEGWKEVDTL